ncbi:unnamed protein product [Schistosoma curassoni]|uniref:Uncharacterized protein n=1 Tax=Schistosoma curassoni TaxID=6186 RepID=A0A183L3T6_9TREM|nr:unnamed protein product [Schistosoma curassoni]
MEHPENVRDREDQSNSSENEEIQFGSTRNQRNPLDPSWTEMDRFGKDAVVFWSRRRKYLAHSGSGSGAVQKST